MRRAAKGQVEGVEARQRGARRLVHAARRLESLDVGSHERHTSRWWAALLAGRSATPGGHAQQRRLVRRGRFFASSRWYGSRPPPRRSRERHPQRGGWLRCPSSGRPSTCTSGPGRPMRSDQMGEAQPRRVRARGLRRAPESGPTGGPRSGHWCTVPTGHLVNFHANVSGRGATETTAHRSEEYACAGTSRHRMTTSTPMPPPTRAEPPGQDPRRSPRAR